MKGTKKMKKATDIAELIASAMFIGENEQFISGMSASTFLPFVCTIIETWCEGNDKDTVMVSELIHDSIVNVHKRENS